MFSLKAKKIMTSFDLAAIVKEINETISGLRLENIYQISPLTLLLVFYPRQSLVVEAGRRIHLTQYEVDKPSFPSLFCRILRRLLKGGLVNQVKMHDFERVVSLEILAKGIKYNLVIEIFGKGNIILVNDEEVILHALSYRKMRDRKILRGNQLKPPPPRGLNPLNISRQDFERLKEQNAEMVKALSRFLAIGGLYTEELLLRLNLNKNKKTSFLTREEIDKIYEEVLNLLSSLKKIDPHIVLDEEAKMFDVLPFPLKIYSNCEIKRYNTYNEAVDEYFTKLSSEGGSSEYNEMIRNIERQKRNLNQQQEHLKVLSQQIIEKKRSGDIIYIHFSEIINIFEYIKSEKHKGKAWNTITDDLQEKYDNKTSNIFIESVDLTKGKIEIILNGLKIELNTQKSVAENASLLYDEGKKMETKIEGLKKAIVETENKIEKCNKIKIRLNEEETSPRKQRKKAWFEKFHWIRSSENFLIIGGRDASTNEILIKRHTDANDLVFHSEITGAPFVVLKTEGKKPSEETIFDAAQLAASYSRGWREGYSSLDVYWVSPNQISKQAPSGEFLSKGMFMIRGKKNYIKNVPLRIAIGVLENTARIVGGAVNSINAHTMNKVILIPGKQSSGKIAKIVRNKLAANAPEESRKKILKLKIEEIQRFIPSGKSEFLK